MLTGETRVIGKNGNLMCGEDEIMGGGSNLPDGLKIGRVDGPIPFGIITDDANFLLTSVTNLSYFHMTIAHHVLRWSLKKLALMTK